MWISYDSNGSFDWFSTILVDFNVISYDFDWLIDVNSSLLVNFNVISYNELLEGSVGSKLAQPRSKLPLPGQ